MQLLGLYRLRLELRRLLRLCLGCLGSRHLQGPFLFNQSGAN